jgi:uncharacterized membrane protein
MKMHRFACWSLGIVFVVVGLAHFASVENFSKMIPEALPYKPLAVILTGILELILAVGLIFPATRIWAGRAIFLVLVLYTPLHVIDLMRETPVIGPKVVAIIRLPIQGVMLYLAWLIGWPRK